MAAKGQIAIIKLDEGTYYDLRKLAQLATNATAKRQRWVRDVETHVLHRLTTGILEQTNEQFREQNKRKLAAEGLTQQFGNGAPGKSRQ
ncbi:hypothetical protein [Terriglobus albidus]|uniref:hypothetical protein n=1 Tax=Terriglobus albidus TaxID=1592106 RepID=UPI0021DF6082|nr:hypothetical protein [Terriglobus albidus]